MLDEKGSLVWRVLFGVVMAGLLIGIFLVYTTTQRRYGVGSKAQELANDLSHTAFSSLPNEQEVFTLWESLDGANYELDLENHNILIRITGGSQEGDIYKSGLGAKLEKRGSLPQPGEKLYFQGRVDKVILSSSPIGGGIEPKLKYMKGYRAPAFYEFAKENPRTATGLISSYYYARENHPEIENLDVKKYEWEAENKLKTLVTSDNGFPTSLLLHWKKYDENIGEIESSWVVTQIENLKESNSISENCPSLEKAHLTGWLYSPERVINNIRSRSWRDKENNSVTIPSNLDPKAAMVTTNVGKYPARRFEFETGGKKYTFYFTSIPWKYSENRAGFVYESEPELRVIR